ncbi:MAG: trypsin-like peptidase domain-containing protein [Planctomycetes bacterium]|nr:trypsin-like peptidase domain-containing protein [Planctomycetota bacterium]
MLTRRALSVALACFTGGVLAAHLLPQVDAHEPSPGTATAWAGDSAANMTPDADAKRRLRRTAIVEAVEKSAPSVVSVGTTKINQVRYFDWAAFRERSGQQELKGLGSGVIVDPSGLVVTNAHVINQADQVVVRLTGLDPTTENEIPATILAIDLAHDLALLRLENAGPYPAATFGQSDDLMPGEPVIAIGSPVGLGRTVSSGIVSALNRSMTIERQTFEGLIQTDAAVNRGNSGGALLNILGEWIGVNSAIASLSQGGGFDGISFAIPIATVKQFLSHAIQSGRATGRWAGLEFGDDGRGHVVIQTLYPVGPAVREGLRRGDRVVAVDGRPVSDGALATLAVFEAASRGAAADHVTLSIQSDDGVRRVAVPLETPPTAKLAWDRLGMKAVEVTPEVREQTGYLTGSGLVVQEVRDGSPAARVGFQPGDLLLAIGTQTLRASEDLLEALQWADKGSTVGINLVRPVRTRFGVEGKPLAAKVVLD